MARFYRSLEPEWLDELPPQDRRAARSRADLRRINALMGNAHVVARALAEFLPPGQPARIADIGGGDGSFMLQVARSLRRTGMRVALVDRAPSIADGTRESLRALKWRVEVVPQDAVDFLCTEQAFDAIIANLFLHHLREDRLVRLLACAARTTPLFIACEPQRSRFALAASRLVGLLGANDVTRHDAVVSVCAGFRDRELSLAWPRLPGWRLIERRAGAFSHLFVALRDWNA
jgi:2-polyprenyl-3-methyl-5-hydroxy-6-metoxy-1,4-benzoquinol methylase